MSEKKRILFLCVGNACRSPMGEGLLRHLAGDRYASLSAGTHPIEDVHPYSVHVMHEIGVDIFDHRTKCIDEFEPPQGTPPDVIVCLSDFASSYCPEFSGTGKLYWPTRDPFGAQGTEEEQLLVFRWVRDQIQRRIVEALEDGTFEGRRGFDRYPEGGATGLGKMLGGLFSRRREKNDEAK